MIGLGVIIVSVGAVFGIAFMGGMGENQAVPIDQGQAGMMAPDPTLPDTLARQEPVPEVIGSGQASYYGAELEGRPTASGELFDPAGMTAAHRTLPLGTEVRVTNLRNERSVVVRINDRGPFVGRRVIDVSHEAARRLGMLHSGTAPVRLELLASVD